MNNLSKVIEEHAQRVFIEFSEKQGSREIARVDALATLGEIIVRKEIKSILEIGCGIGTVTHFLQNTECFGELRLIGFEKDEWCRDQLRTNVSEISILSELSQLESLSVELDLLVIDDFLDYQVTQTLIANTSPKFIFIEGHRRIQRLYVLKAIKSNNSNFQFRNFPKTQKSSKVGCLFDCTAKNSNYISAYVFIYFSLLYSKITELRSRIKLRPGN
jgi:precorrin-6B methylase 2